MRDAIIIWLIQHFEADFLWKVSLKILNSGLIRKTFIHVTRKYFLQITISKFKYSYWGFWYELFHYILTLRWNVLYTETLCILKRSKVPFLTVLRSHGWKLMSNTHVSYSKCFTVSNTFLFCPHIKEGLPGLDFTKCLSEKQKGKTLRSSLIWVCTFCLELFGR